ncbi:MAG: hypothetical protein ACR2NB_00070 [Solirubrobacteraceae bacterium]
MANPDGLPLTASTGARVDERPATSSTVIEVSGADGKLRAAWRPDRSLSSDRGVERELVRCAVGALEPSARSPQPQMIEESSAALV